MSARSMVKNKPILDAIAQFPQYGNLTLAKMVLSQHGDIYDNDVEKIRSIIRYYRGALGDKDRKKVGLKSPITPLHMPQSWVQPKQPYNLPPGLWLFMPDIHVPFHEPKPIEAAINYAKKNKVDGIVLVGDARDCASIGFWPVTHKRDFDKETIIFIDFLAFLRQEFSRKKIIYKLGNHEARLPKMYYQKAENLGDLHFVALDTVLDLEGKGIETVDYYQMIQAGKLPVMHGHEVKISSAVNPARGLFLKTSTFAACAHFHQTSMHPGKNLNGDMLTTWSFGCLCDLHPDYNPWGNSWNWGFALINVEKDGNFEVDNRRVLANGKVV